MRLSAAQIEAIKQQAGHFFSAQAGVCLFGSRAVSKQRGLTLVELITIMLILGILAAVAVPRFFDSNAFQSRGTADQVRAALRYGQKVAIAQHRNVTVNITAAADSNCGAVLAGGNVNCVILDSVTVVPALPQTVSFDALGRRTAGLGALTVGSTTITIEAETGYVH